MMISSKKVIVVMGMVGSGKDTQSDILAAKLGYTRIRTSKLLQAEFDNSKPEDSDYELIQEQKRVFIEGLLNDPTWVISVVVKHVKALESQNVPGIIFSSSPRTLPEAEVLFPELEKVYGKEAIIVFHVTIGLEEAVKRNVGRYVCEENGHPFRSEEVEHGMVTCSLDGSKIIKRQGLDDEDTIRNVRYPEYIEKTSPIFEYLKENAINLVEINGEQSIEAVARDISKYIFK